MAITIHFYWSCVLIPQTIMVKIELQNKYYVIIGSVPLIVLFSSISIEFSKNFDGTAFNFMRGILLEDCNKI